MVINNEEHVCIWEYQIMLLFSAMILVWSRKAIAESSRIWRSYRETEEPVNNNFSRNSGTYIVYNSHVTCSNSSFSLIMVTPTSHFFAFHLLCCLLPIGYLPKPDSLGVRICHYHWIQPRPSFRWFSDIFDRMHLFSTSPVFTAPQCMVTFQQSTCWYYPWADV